MSATYTYDPTATSSSKWPVYQLRMLMSDTDFSAIGEGLPRAARSTLFSDEEYQAFLSASGSDIIYSWSLVLQAVAVNRSLMSVYVNLGGGGDVDFRAISSQLMELSQQVLTRYSQIPAEAYAEIAAGPAAAAAIFINHIMRSM